MKKISHIYILQYIIFFAVLNTLFFTPQITHAQGFTGLSGAGSGVGLGGLSSGTDASAVNIPSGGLQLVPGTTGTSIAAPDSAALATPGYPVADIGGRTLSLSDVLLNGITSGAAPVTAGATTVGATNSIYEIFRKDVLNKAVVLVARTLLRAITVSTIKWINSGFQGNPAYVTDLKAAGLRVADQVAEQFLARTLDAIGLCEPFKTSTIKNLTNQYSKSTTFDGLKCSLSQQIASQVNFSKFVGGDFSQGGWDGWFSMTQNPQNNWMGSYLLADDALNAELAAAKANNDQQLNWGRGFQPATDCKEKDPNTGQCKKNGPVKTPGSVIEDQLATVMGSDIRQIELAKDVNDVIGALLGKLTNDVLGKVGLGGIDGAALGMEAFGALAADGPDQQFKNELAQNDKTLQVNSDNVNDLQTKANEDLADINDRKTLAAKEGWTTDVTTAQSSFDALKKSGASQDDINQADVILANAKEIQKSQTDYNDGVANIVGLQQAATDLRNQSALLTRAADVANLDPKQAAISAGVAQDIANADTKAVTNLQTQIDTAQKTLDEGTFVGDLDQQIADLQAKKDQLITLQAAAQDSATRAGLYQQAYQASLVSAIADNKMTADVVGTLGNVTRGALLQGATTAGQLISQNQQQNNQAITNALSTGGGSGSVGGLGNTSGGTTNTTAPTIQITSPTTGASTGYPISIAYTVTATNLTNLSCYYSLDNGATHTTPQTCTNGPNTFPIITPSATGPLNIIAYLKYGTANTVVASTPAVNITYTRSDIIIGQ